MRKISTKTPVRNSGLHIFTAYPQLSKPNRLVPERMVSTIVFVISGELFHDFFFIACEGLDGPVMSPEK